MVRDSRAQQQWQRRVRMASILAPSVSVMPLSGAVERSSPTRSSMLDSRHAHSSEQTGMDTAHMDTTLTHRSARAGHAALGPGVGSINSFVAPSPSPPLPNELRPFTYQRDSSHAQAEPTTEVTALTHASEHSDYSAHDDGNDHEPPSAGIFGDSDDEYESISPALAPAHPTRDARFEDVALVPPPDLLAPPLSPQQMEELYQMTADDYMVHLGDCLRIRVTAFLLILGALGTWIYLSQNYWIIVIACIYLIIAALLGIRGSIRGDHEYMEHYTRALIGWLFIFVLGVAIWMAVTGVEPDIQQRCGVSSFVASYGSNCTSSASQFASCQDRCEFEMRINLNIEAMGLAGLIAATISFLVWDASRVCASLRLWRYHPLRATWHSDRVLLNRYADTRRQAKVPPAEEEERDEGTNEQQQEEPSKATIAQPSTSGVSRTYGSGVVGRYIASHTTARRRQGPLTQIFQEQQQKLA